jgi:DUF1009 family protein
MVYFKRMIIAPNSQLALQFAPSLTKHFCELFFLLSVSSVVDTNMKNTSYEAVDIVLNANILRLFRKHVLKKMYN